MHGRKWETFNETKVIFRQWEHVFAADQKTSLLAVLFGLSDASLRRSSLREDFDTRVADDRIMESSGGNFAGVVPEHTRVSRVLAVCSFDRTGGHAVLNLSKGKLLSFICVRVRKNLSTERLGRMKEQSRERTNGITEGQTNEGEREEE